MTKLNSTDDKFPEFEYSEIIRTSEGAICFNVWDNIEDGVWIPKSQINEHDENKKVFNIPHWLAVEKELI